MLFSTQWLADYVALPESVEDLADKLTAIGLNVEGIEPAGAGAVLDVEVTANRPDCMNHLGLAREIAAAYGVAVEKPSVSVSPTVESVRSSSISVEIEDPEGCPRYSAVVVRGIRVGASPSWMVERLEAIGSRSINNIVDVTNFVLWETGQPLHAFDLRKVAGASIVVRRGRSGEKLVTLDGEERELDESILVICDGEGPTALAGIMGGAASEVTEATVDVLIESAHFARSLVRGGARRLGLKTDASHRFERGADPEGCLAAALRAAELMADLAGGTIEPVAVDARPLTPEPVRGSFEHAALERFAGTRYETSFVERTLAALGFELEAAEEGAWRVTVPSWRRFDFELDPQGEVYPAYFYEEVMRLAGFEPIPSTLPAVVEPDAGTSAGHRLRERVRRQLAASGLAETITYAFYDPRVDARFGGLERQGEPLGLANALSEQYECMRRSMLPNLVAGALFNQRRGAGAVRLFEVGHLFPGADTAEVEALGVVLGGAVGSPWEGRRELDFFDLKGILEDLAAGFGAAPELTPADLPGMVAGTGAEIGIGGSTVGYLGRVEEEDAAYPLFAAEIELAPLAADWVPQVTPPSRHPGVAVDLTLTHALDVPWAALESAIDENRPDDLRAFGLKDLYRGEGVPEGAVNTTISFRYGADDRSLTQEEVNERHQDLSARLEKLFGWRA